MTRSVESQRLPALRGIALVGPETDAFLQSLTTNDMAAIVPERLAWGAITNVKGRVMALCCWIRLEQGWAMAVAESLASTVYEYLLRMRFRRKVEISMLSDSHGITVDWLDEAPQLRLAESSAAAQFEDGSARWQRYLVQSGIPQIGAETSELFLPQHLNLEALGALSFQKGCYPGQEVVVRTQHLGTIKRVLVRGPGEAPPGTLLRTRRDGQEVDAGRVVCAAGGQMLAVVPVELLGKSHAFYTLTTPPVAAGPWTRL